MNGNYTEIRRDMTEQGYKMTDEQYDMMVSYARRKAESAGKDESYLPYLIPDVIREWFIQNAVNSFTAGLMELQRREKEVTESGTTAITATNTAVTGAG